MARARIGCTGWSYPDWVGPFYAPGTPASEWLTAYARAFDFVEVDSSFYAAPPRERVEAWARATPPGFTFSLKLPKSLTHERKLRDVDDEVGAFLVALAPLRREGKLGPLVAQLPPSFKRDTAADDLAALSPWPRDVPLRSSLTTEP